VRRLLKTRQFGQRIVRLISQPELAAMRKRIEHLLRTRTYPAPSLHRRNYPWPPI
jgi:hypothetical protein